MTATGAARSTTCARRSRLWPSGPDRKITRSRTWAAGPVCRLLRGTTPAISPVPTGRPWTRSKESTIPSQQGDHIRCSHLASARLIWADFRGCQQCLQSIAPVGMGEPGVEPGCPYGQGILSPQRLPFRHSPECCYQRTYVTKESQGGPVGRRFVRARPHQATSRAASSLAIARCATSGTSPV